MSAVTAIKEKAAEGGSARPRTRRQRVRMAPDDRERMILEAATHYFARHGFSAQIRELARELKVSQGLIYRYFSSKQELVDRVYQHNFLRRWDASWEDLLRDRSVPLRDRLKDFYTRYLGAIDDPDWIRLVMHSGLEGNDLTRRYIRTRVEHLLRIIARECRLVPRAGEPDQAEMEMVWHLHSTIIYYLVRKHIFRTATTRDVPGLVAMIIDDFLSGLAGGPGALGKIAIPRRRNGPCP
jgi:AcrR family transcriptional regulator